MDNTAALRLEDLLFSAQKTFDLCVTEREAEISASLEEAKAALATAKDDAKRDVVGAESLCADAQEAYREAVTVAAWERRQLKEGKIV